MKKTQYLENLITTTSRTSTRTTTTFVAIGDPFPGPKMCTVDNCDDKLMITLRTLSANAL